MTGLVLAITLAMTAALGSPHGHTVVAGSFLRLHAPSTALRFVPSTWLVVSEAPGPCKELSHRMTGQINC